MTRIAYQEYNPTPATLKVIDQADSIMAEYQGQGFVLTLRQLYYQFVARGLLVNTLRSYKRLGSIVNDARVGGLLDWESIEDRTRNLVGVPSWDDPESIIYSASRSFRVDMWERQPWHVEVWIEKEALAGVFDVVCREERVDFFACRGYTSQSEMWRAARRLAHLNRKGKRVLVLHFGDHDPSGIDMTRDVEERFALFGADVTLRRVALNMDQVEEYNPPPNPAKTTDSRHDAYVEKFGTESWELDALEPSALADLVRSNVEEVRDVSQWARDLEREQEHRADLRVISDNYTAALEGAREAE